MAIFWDAPVAPDDVTTFVRQVPVPRRLTLLNLFPVVPVFDNRVDWAEIVQTNRTARYRSFDGRIHVSERDGGSNKWVNLIPLSSSLNKGEYERLQLEFARTGGTNTAALGRAVYNDGQNLTYEVQNRLNQAWGDVLTDGKLTVNEEGFQGEADYGVPAGHLVTAGTAWTTVSAPAIDNLTSWSDTYETSNGAPPEQARTSRRVMRLMQQNTQLIGAIAGTTSGRTRVSMTEINDYLSGEGLPTFGPPIEDRVDVDGVNTRIVPDDRVFLMPADENLRSLGYTASGVSATALELVNSNESELSFEDAPGIVGLVEKVGPPYREFTFVDAVAMPVLVNAKLLMIADVA
jgi:major capsid protein E